MESSRLSLRSLHPITANTELTISYRDESLPFRYRQIYLKTQYGFECKCDLCLLGDTTWRDKFPLDDEVSPQFEQKMRDFAAELGHDGLEGGSIMAYADIKAAMFKAELYPSLHSGAPAHKIATLLQNTSDFFSSTKCWPMYREPRPTFATQQMEWFMKGKQFDDALRIAAKFYFLVEPVQHPEEYHPIRIVKTLRVLHMLMILHVQKRDTLLPFSFGVVSYEIASKVLRYAGKSHGEKSMLYKGVYKEWAEDLGDKKLKEEHKANVKAEMSKMKKWACGEDASITERSLEAIGMKLPPLVS
jgi:hypothetical protein